MASEITKLAHLQIPIENVLKATNNFHPDNVIGHGDFGKAYKGELLRNEKLIKITARRLDRKRGLGGYEYLTEVTMLSNLEHTNLVSIIGFCEEENEKIIVTTYEANGSLLYHLNSPSLTWTQRLRICVGVARALTYLHSDEGRGYVVIHRNINSSTILLDENWEAKLSGFEFCIKQSVNRKNRVILTEATGTMGYMDPAIEKTKGVTHKSDIYSFGVVLFEILCGRKAFIRDEADRFLAPLAKYHYENKTLEGIIHAHLWSQMSQRSLEKYSKAANSCLNEERTHRPNMEYVVNELEHALEFYQQLEHLEKTLKHLNISLDSIKSSTENFSDAYKFNVTGFCTLYRVELDDFRKLNPSYVEGNKKDKLLKRHHTIVVKRILPRNDEEAEKFFFTEIEMLTSVEHHNIVNLLGFCVEGSEMILVIDNFSNGYLGDYLEKVNGMHTFTWEKRLKICIDVAHTLNYLHYEMEGKKTIINRDIKSDNIGLDENWGAKIVDFGLSIFLPPDQEDEALHIDIVAGTPFYIDPEYETTLKLKKESDVYSFGVVLFEILCGRTAYDPIYESDKGLAHVARKSFYTGTLQDMIDPVIKEKAGENNFNLNRRSTKDSMHTFIEIAHQCIAETQDKRPTMKVVVEELEKALLFFQEDEVQRPHIDDELEKASLEIKLTYESIHDDRVQGADIDQVANELDKTILELQLTHENITEEQVQRSIKDEVEDKLEKALGLYKIPEEQVQRSITDEVEDKLEKALGLYKIPEEQVQRSNTDVVEDKLEKALGIYKIPEEQVQRSNTEEVEDTLEKALGIYKIPAEKLEHLKIRLSDIKLATDNFSDTYKIGMTGYCDLYRAELDYFDKLNPSSPDGKNKGEPPKRDNTVVIKRIFHRDDKQDEQVFYQEIKVLTSVKHSNIVNLLGFCVEGFEMILVIENISNGYLGNYLHNVKDLRVLTWEKRLKICIDVANALDYLHSKMDDQTIIVNRDIKSDNIGLDKNWGAKIAEFGLSLFIPSNEYNSAFFPGMIAGTNFYLDPEYEKTGWLKKESDVYSFGVVLFEILCGRLAYDSIYSKTSDKGLAYVARRCFDNGTLRNMIDPMIKEETDENTFILNRGSDRDSLPTFMKIAYQCVAETQNQRPTMKEVVKELEKALSFYENNKDNHRIPLEDIKLATKYFHDGNCIGRGGFGNVYKGNLQDGDGFKTIVAKRLDRKYGQGEQQFLTELQILLEYKHENIVGLIGYCDEQDEKLIVYEYVPRGSLDRYLGDASLTWVNRINICIDVATALDFCHGGVGKQAKVIHRDIKTANILLTDSWKAKLADFGLSLISPINKETDYIIDNACGTPGYLDPLYRKSGFLTIESDIYSFGVVLFEILCGRYAFAIPKHDGQFLSRFIKNIFEEGKHDELVFEHIKEQIVPESLTTFQNVAYQCLHDEREKRPTTKYILEELKKALLFQVSNYHSFMKDSIVP